MHLIYIFFFLVCNSSIYYTRFDSISVEFRAYKYVVYMYNVCILYTKYVLFSLLIFNIYGYRIGFMSLVERNFL